MRDHNITSFIDKSTKTAESSFLSLVAEKKTILGFYKH